MYKCKFHPDSLYIAIGTFLISLIKKTSLKFQNSQNNESSCFSSVSRSGDFPNVLVFISGYNSLDIAKAQVAFMTEAHNKCFADTYNREI